MADYTGNFAVHKTTTAAEQDEITLTANSADYIEISNYDATDELRCTTNGVDVAANQEVDCHLIKPGVTKLIWSGLGADNVKLISAGVVAYSVVGAQ